MEVGAIKTTIYGVDIGNSKSENECGILEYSNCGYTGFSAGTANTGGTVRVYLNEQLSGESDSRLDYSKNQKLEFSIKKNVELEIREEGYESVIQFTNFKMAPCSKGNNE